MAKLVFHLEDEHDIAVPLLDLVSVGSAEGNDVLVDDSTVSPRHAEVTLSPTGSFIVRDLGSASGTFVNGRRIMSYPLCEGDEVTFGNLRGRFVLDDQDRATVLERQQEERDRRKSIERLNKDYEEALGRHKLLLSVIQGLGEEEMKRMGNLDELQRAVSRAEGNLSKTEATARVLAEEAEKHEAARAELQTSIQKLRTEKDELTVKNEALQADVKKSAQALSKKLEEEGLHAQAQLGELAAKREAAKQEVEASEQKSAQAIASLKQQEESLARMREEVELAEKRGAEAKRFLADCENMVSQAAAGRQQAQEKLEQERQALQKLAEERKQSEEALAKLAAKESKLNSTIAALQVSVDDMTQRQSAGLLALRERERSLREVVKGIERGLADQERIKEESRQHEGVRDELLATLSDLDARVAAAEALLAGLDAQVIERESEIAAHTQRLQQLELERNAIQARVKSLAATETELLKAKDELAKTRHEHASLVALIATRDECRQELETIQAQILEVSESRRGFDQDLAAAHAALQQFELHSAAEQERLGKEAVAIEKEISQALESLATANSEVEKANARHQELLGLNRDLDSVDDELRKANAELHAAQHQHNELTRKTAAFEKDADRARAALEAMQADLKATHGEIERLRVEETSLEKAILKLEAEQVTEKRRLEDLRHQAVEAERKAEADRVAMAAELENRRREIQALADEFHGSQVLRAEVDALYARIESSGADPAAALAAWKEAQKKKEKLAGILPKEGGIRVRPQVRTVLVPRSKDA